MHILFNEQTVYERSTKTVKSLSFLWWIKPCWILLLMPRRDLVCSMNKDERHILIVQRTETRKPRLSHLKNRGTKKADLNYGIGAWQRSVQPLIGILFFYKKEEDFRSLFCLLNNIEISISCFSLITLFKLLNKKLLQLTFCCLNYFLRLSIYIYIYIYIYILNTFRKLCINCTKYHYWFSSVP